MDKSDVTTSDILPVLFLDEDGEQFQFSIRGSEKHFASTVQKIKEGGGYVNIRRNGPYTILLDQPTSRIFGEEEVFSVQFISDCCEKNCIQDINKYRLNKNSKYKNDFDFNKILLRKVSWSEVPLESTHDKEEDDFFPIYEKDPNVFKKVSRPYTTWERMAIVDYIVKEKAYSKIRGNALWKDMEDNGVCEDRTWQSLKEHFKKKIFPNIRSYGLDEQIVKKFFLWDEFQEQAF